MDKRKPLKNILRLALPALADFGEDSPLPYAWFDRRGRCARQGELTLRALGHAYPQAACEAVLHPADVIATTVHIPDVARARFAAAVHSALEPLVLSDLDALAIGHGPRGADGAVPLAWAAREPVRRAWSLLNAQGLRAYALIATQTLAPDASAPDASTPLRDPADPRWLAPSPSWSLAMPRLAPARASRWRPVWRWSAAAAVVWIAGLNGYASQLRAEADALRDGMRRQVLAAFPDLPVVLDPARQAQQGLDALQANRGAAGAGDFLPLARAAAQALPFAADKVARLTYADQSLTLQLADAGEQSQRVAETPALIQQAAALGLKLERADSDHTWRVTRAQP
ncbi:type II secretion system protein GspL [Achromobacter denitrificans]|uniref:type II secretion system protein GspL n=1 Tax=Achromobacter denitrificans TaxID=32002 RepID=UPI0023E7D855|nr:type II secretion system protein GspL [Achromobacter denitrificans]MDF3847560.1 type II secretion system protein GspL [Achromobacter denitrificans]